MFIGDLFDNYALETAKIFVNQYPWFYIPASVHKILMHGAQIIENAILPIGLLSEEAQEARNKDIKRYREHNTRKTSRLHTMQDLFNNLLISSDPLISSLRKLKKKNQILYGDEAKNLVFIGNAVTNEENNVQEMDNAEIIVESDEEEMDIYYQ